MPLDFHLPLGQPPRLLQAAVACHGHRPIERYRLPGIWCVHAYCYPAQLLIDDQLVQAQPGHVGIFPPGAPLEFRFRVRPSIHVYAHYVLKNQPPTVAVPAMQNLGQRFDRFYCQMEQIVAWLPTQQRRAEARLWDLLWELSESAAPGRGSKPGHPAMEQALQWIELHLGQPIRVASLARHVGLSHNQLTRLFHQHLGTTVVSYIRHRRLDRAEHLLRHSTQPIKAIAAQVGIPDLQRFNKLIHRAHGRGPRDLRNAHA